MVPVITTNNLFLVLLAIAQHHTSIDVTAENNRAIHVMRNVKCVLMRVHVCWCVGTRTMYEYIYMSIERTHFLTHSQYAHTAMLEMSDGKLNVSILSFSRTVQYSAAQ